MYVRIKLDGIKFSHEKKERDHDTVYLYFICLHSSTHRLMSEDIHAHAQICLPVTVVTVSIVTLPKLH